MSVKIVIKPNTYFDSVSLMSISTRANKLDGVEQAFVAMATEMNKGVLKNLGLLTPELEQAKNGDLMIVINGKSGVDNEQLLAEIEELFNTKALQNDLNVMLFSDNVSVEDELALKQLAHEKGLLMMGPDCGTAIINGAALCFGNAVRRGNIGIVGASGTGSQELSVRIHEFGGGVSQLIGTGGRDLSEKIGGLTIRKLKSLCLSPNRLRLRWPAKCWNAHAPAASQWWPASSVVAKRQWMSRGYSLLAAAKRRH